MFSASSVVGMVALAVIVVLILLYCLTQTYVKAPPNIAYIISGWSKEPRVLKGQGGIRIPFLERIDNLYLGQMSVDIKTGQPVPTNDFINVTVDAVAKVQVERTPEGIRLAAKNFLNRTPEQIASDLRDSLEGNMREIVGTLTLKDINTDRDSFSDQVMKKAAGDMQKLGIEILSCNIQNVTDENGLIRDLGMDNTSKIKKDAAIAKAVAERDVKIVEAQADKEANDARVKSDTEIAERQNELAIKRAELKKISDIKKAEADAAYEIQRQEQMKTIQTATVNANIARTEREDRLKLINMLLNSVPKLNWQDGNVKLKQNFMNSRKLRMLSVLKDRQKQMRFVCGVKRKLLQSKLKVKRKPLRWISVPKL